MRRRSLDERCPKIKCEIEECTVKDPKLLERHHIVERKDIGTSNHEFNLCVLCSLHHSMIHTGRLKIIGVFPSTSKRSVIYELDGKRNIEGIDESYFNYHAPSMKIPQKD